MSLNLGQVHWEAAIAKQIIRYLKGTKKLKLLVTYGENGKDGLVGYADADGASQEHRRAISGYVVLIDGGAVLWCLKKQELITLSTMEAGAEYVSATHTAKELMWIRCLLDEVFRPLKQPIVLFSDNQSALQPLHLVTLRGNFTLEQSTLILGIILSSSALKMDQLISSIATEDMIADILTSRDQSQIFYS